MTAASGLRRRLLRWLEPRVPARVPERDQIGEHLRAAIAADERAKATNSQTYQARVDAMIDDFFSKYGDRDARRRS